ncbi:VWA domain-containing protein [Streptomyces sp. NPDC001508]|uniref:VWA domain-containing protein n=1 Tax=Streptomyces sp. NPDC001508 TaxID=3154656 RepID=UPI0033229C6E
MTSRTELAQPRAHRNADPTMPSDTDPLSNLEPAASAVVRAWLNGGRFGLLLAGDSWHREHLWRHLSATIQPTPAVLGPGTDPAALHGGIRWPFEDTAPPGLLERAATALLVPAPEMVDPAVIAAAARCPRILASAASLDDVPEALARRLTAVVILGMGDKSTTEPTTTTFAEPRKAPDPADVVNELNAYGLLDHSLDVDTTRLAIDVTAYGAEPLEVVRRYVCEPRGADIALPPPPHPADETHDEQTPEKDHDDQSGENPVRDDQPQADGGESEPNSAADTDESEQPAQEPQALPAPQQRPTSRERRAARRYLEGRRGSPQDNPRRGRAHRVVTADRAAGRLAILPTVQAAAPWQPIRRNQPRPSGDNPAGPDRMVIRPEDLRGHMRRRRGGRVVLIVVDASGSMAQRAIRTAKGHAMSVLDQVYRERAHVGIIIVRGQQATIGLPLTRSTTRARASLRALPTGGGTPLASGLMLAARLARQYEPAQVETLLITDGRANVGIAGNPREDTERAAGLLKAACKAVRVIDPTPRPARSAWLTDIFDIS